MAAQFAQNYNNNNNNRATLEDNGIEVEYIL